MLLLWFKALAAVQLDDQTDFETHEIQIERSDPVLPTEFALVQTTVPKALPDQ
jgi:hypothetical protein